MIQRYRQFIKISYTLLLILIPFIRLNGDSLLRFDIPTLKLYFFGAIIGIENFFIILILIFFVTFAFILATQIYGRVWCGWLCPQTVVVDFTRFIDFMGKKPFINKLFNYSIVLIISIIIAANMVWYFVDPYSFLSSLMAGNLSSVTAWFWGVISILTFLNFAFLRHTFCKTVCPYAKLQSILYDDHTMIIAMDSEREDECIGCNQCVKVCPVNIDIGKGVNSACIMCAECVDACEVVMQKYSGSKSLIKYAYGAKDTPKFFRPTVLITSAITMIFFLIFMIMVLSMKPFDFGIYPNQKFSPRQTGDNVINAYEVVINNESREMLTVKLHINGYEGYTIQPQAQFDIPPNESLKKDIFLTIPASFVEKRPILTMNMIAVSASGVELESELSFRRPFKRSKVKKKK